jgi:hypothetical protein
VAAGSATNEELLDAPDDIDEFNVWAEQQGWSDGLPLIPPSPERVARALRFTDREPDQVLGMVPPRWADATVEKITANAVMAGCRPEFLPIVIAAVEALLLPSVNLFGQQATTHPCSSMVMVNGPLARQVGIHSGSGLFGPGFAANASIGRAVRLVLRNIGGALPGEGDRSTQGGPAKFTFCFAENEEESPFPPFHTERGFAADDSTVTVASAESPHNIEDHVSSEPAALMGTIAYSIANIGGNNAYIRDSDFFVGLCPEHARILANHGWRRKDVQEFIFEQARIPYSRWRGRGLDGVVPQRHYMQAGGPDLMIPMCGTPDDVLVMVVGGPGLHSCWIPTWANNSRAATHLIRHADGKPARNIQDFKRGG